MSGETRSSVDPMISRVMDRERAILARPVPMDERATDAELEQDSGGNLLEDEPSADRVHARQSRSDDLVDTVTNHIIPRLLLAHRMDARELDRVPDTRRPPTVEEIAALAEVAVDQDLQAAMKLVEVRLHEGLSLETLLLDWIAAAARLLGDQWLSDDKSFAQVTLGLGTLHRMLATLRHRLRPAVQHRGLVVLVTAPGEQHTLAIHVLGDLLQHAGWEAVVKPNLPVDELVAMVSCEPVVMVGISVSSDDFLAPVERIIARVRQSSLNRDLAVMLGGSIDMSSHADEMGAIFCPSARIALAWLGRHARVSL